MTSSSNEQQREVTEYRILALYRFLPLVDTTNQRNNSNHSNNNTSSNDDNNTFTAAANAAADVESWDEKTLMKHPERHPQLVQLQSELYSTLRKYETRGTLLIAPEGINGTICYPHPPPITAQDHDSQQLINNNNNNNDDPVKTYLTTHPLFGGSNLRTRSSIWTQPHHQNAFQRLKIKIKPEIVTLGLGRPITDHTTHIPTPHPQRHAQNELANPNIIKGTYLNPRQWDDAMKDPDVLVIDTRNSYEIEIGTFESAVDPCTQHFSEFPEYLERLAGDFDWSGLNGELVENGGKNDGDDGVVSNVCNESAQQQQQQQQQQLVGKKKKTPPKAIAMFCTGGIRCEKATSYALQSNLFPKNLPIYHLEGGILSYLDDVAKRNEPNSNDDDDDDTDEKKQQDSSTFHGECFVFDKRVALTEGLEPSNKYISCHGCRGPMDRRLLEDNGGSVDKSSVEYDSVALEGKKKYEQLLMGIRKLPPLTFDTESQKWYVPGLTCPRCHDGTTRESFERFAQRKEQMEICAREGKSHFQDNGRK